MAETLTGRCLCGNCRLTAEGPPRFAILCYCRDCQQVSGAAALPQVGVTRDGLTLSGPVEPFRRQSDSGCDQEQGFCRTCGSVLYRTTERAAEIAFVPAGILDAPAQLPEFRPVYEDSRPAWDAARRQPAR